MAEKPNTNVLCSMNWGRSYGKRVLAFSRRKLLEALPILLLDLTLLSCGTFDNDLRRLEEDLSPNLLIADKDSIEFEGLGHKQSMVFYENIALFLYETSCDLFDLSSLKKVSILTLPCDGYLTPHANSLSLGVNKYSQLSVLPLLYVSAWDNGRQAFVYDIALIDGRYQGRLIQVIDPGNVSSDIIGDGFLDWVIDTDSECMYSIAYHLKGSSQLYSGNYMHITKFAIPSLESQSVILSDSDVLDSFSVPVMTVFQDKCYYDGHIFVAAGHPGLGVVFDPKIFDIDLKNKTVIETLIPIEGEPEGLCVYEGTKWLNFYGSSKVYNLDSLLRKL